VDRNQAYSEFRRLHERAKSGELGDEDRERWKQLKRLLATLDQPEETGSDAAVGPGSERSGVA
jgi:hypothetical protein